MTFANGLFPYFHSIVTGRPIPIETKCHWKSSITYSGIIGQMRGGSDISDFLSHFCKHPPKERLLIFSPIQYSKRSHACQSCLYRWQLPWGTVTVHGPLFQLETGSMLGHLLWNSENSLNHQRVKCRGLPFKISGVSEAKWTADMYGHRLQKSPVCTSERALGIWRITEMH